MPHILLMLTLVLGLALQTTRPPRVPVTDRTIRSSTVPVSPVALVTYMVRGHADSSTDLLYIVWRGREGWYRGMPRSGSGGGSGQRFTASEIYGTVRLDLEVDLAARSALVQGHRVELGEANVVLVDAIDRGTEAKVLGTLRVETAGDPGPRPDAPLRLLGSHPDIVRFAGCPQSGSVDPVSAPGYCWMLIGKEH